MSDIRYLGVITHHVNNRIKIDCKAFVLSYVRLWAQEIAEPVKVGDTIEFSIDHSDLSVLWAINPILVREPVSGHLSDELPAYQDTPTYFASANRIARLEQELLGAHMAMDIEQARGNALGKENERLGFHAACMEQAEREEAVNEGYEAGVESRNEEVAQLKTRVEELEACLHHIHDFPVVGSRGLLLVERLAGKALGLITGEDQNDHAEIAARQADYNDAKDAGTGIYF